MSFLLFLVSGVGSTLLDLLIFSTLILFFDKSLSYAASYCICICCRYLFDSRVTFAAEHRAHGGNRFAHYFAGNFTVMFFGLAVYNLLLLLPLAPAHALTLAMAGHAWAFTPPHIAKLVAKLLSIPVTVLSGYVLMKRLVFRTPAGRADAGE